MTQAKFGVESTTDLKTGTWTNVPLQVQSDGINRFAELPIGFGRMFFHLRGRTDRNSPYNRGCVGKDIFCPTKPTKGE